MSPPPPTLRAIAEETAQETPYGCRTLGFPQKKEEAHTGGMARRLIDPWVSNTSKDTTVPMTIIIFYYKEASLRHKGKTITKLFKDTEFYVQNSSATPKSVTNNKEKAPSVVSSRIEKTSIVTISNRIARPILF